MKAISLVLLLMAIHKNTNPKAEGECRAKDHDSLPSEMHKEPFHSHTIDDRLDGYPMGIESYLEENIVTTKFYKDLRYMTLDHEADYLWQEHLHMVTGNIKLPPADENGNASLKAIAM